MIKITWKDEKVSTKLLITQVYGIVFDKTGRILLKVENKKGKKIYSFGGGTPEEFDNGIKDTLRREMIEELNTTLKNDIFYLGYQLIENDGERLPYAQVRMTAMIQEINNKKPDPDNGETYDRVLVSPQKAIKLLNWGEVGKLQIEKAVKSIKENLDLIIATDDEEIWI
ncbi:MAG: NUDIX domain-containing protein [Clostridia bacterium]|nr:NUDIX domain-containing protein [Clostridia bacterium]